MSEPQSELCTELVRESASWLLRPSSVRSTATDNLAHTDHLLCLLFHLCSAGKDWHHHGCRLDRGCCHVVYTDLQWLMHQIKDHMCTLYM